MILRKVTLSIYILLFCLSLHARVFYVDPVHGSVGGDGSYNDPLPGLRYLLSNDLIRSFEPIQKPHSWNGPLKRKNINGLVQPGDTIMCFSGYYGSILIENYYNGEYITIMAVDGHDVQLRNIHVRASSHWRFKGLKVSPSFHPEFVQYRNIVNLESHNFAGPVSDIEIVGCHIFSHPDIYSWSAQDWLDNVGSGISAAYYSRRFRIVDNYIENVDFGISIATDGALVRNNDIVNFSGDGLRGNGSNMIFDHNRIMNNYKVDDNHDDAFQGFNFGVTDTFFNVQLTNNLVIQNADPNQPIELRGNLQGLAFFDGNIKNWYVANNVVIVDHYHGISLYGCHECLVTNNTVVDQNINNRINPWILVRSKKSGEPIQGNIVVNNIATSITLSDDTDPRVERNLIISGVDYEEHFKDPRNRDFHLLPTSRAIDAALIEFSPNEDFYGNSRPYGAGPEIGAIECIEDCNISYTQDKGEDNSWLIFPNPTSSELTIYHQGHKQPVNLIDNLGRVVMTVNLNYSGSTNLDMSLLPSGIYRIRAMDDQGERLVSIIKK